MEHGTIIATVDGEAVDDLSKIPGGSKVELQARADRGWHFKNWVVNGTAQDEAAAKTNGTYTISELAAICPSALNLPRALPTPPRPPLQLEQRHRKIHAV